MAFYVKPSTDPNGNVSSVFNTNNFQAQSQALTLAEAQSYFIERSGDSVPGLITFNGGLSASTPITFPQASILSTDINNSSFIDLSSQQTINGQKTFADPLTIGAGSNSNQMLNVNGKATVSRQLTVNGSLLLGNQNVGTTLSDLQTSVSALQGSSTSQQSSLDNLNNIVIPVIQTNVSTTAGNVSTLQTDVSNLQSDVSTLQSDVAAIQSNDNNFVTSDSLTSSLSSYETIDALTTKLNSYYTKTQANSTFATQTVVNGINSTLNTITGEVNRLLNPLSKIGAQATTATVSNKATVAVAAAGDSTQFLDNTSDQTVYGVLTFQQDPVFPALTTIEQKLTGIQYDSNATYTNIGNVYINGDLLCYDSTSGQNVDVIPTLDSLTQTTQSLQQSVANCLTSSSLTPYLLSSTAQNLYQPQSAMSSYATKTFVSNNYAKSSDLTAVQTKQSTDEQTIASIQSSVATIQSNQTADESTIASQASAISTLQTNQQTNTSNITSLLQSVSSIQTKQTADEATIASQGSQISNLYTVIGTDEASISQINSNIQSIDASLNSISASVTSLNNSLTSIQNLSIVSIDTSLNTIQSSIVQNFEVPLSASVYADGDPPVAMGSTQLYYAYDGWYYTNSSAGKKINWYFPSNITIGQIVGVYLNAYILSTASVPAITIYTNKKATGNMGSFYNARINIDIGPSYSGGVGKTCMYAAMNGSSFTPVVANHSNYALVVETTNGLSQGNFLPDDSVFAIVITTNSATTAAGQVSFILSSLNVVTAQGTCSFQLSNAQVQAAADEASIANINTTIANLSTSSQFGNFVTSGYVQNQLLQYVTNTSLQNQLSSYVTQSSLLSQNLVPFSTLQSMLGSYLTQYDASQQYATISSLSGYLSSSLTPYLLSSTANSTYQTQSAMNSYYTKTFIQNNYAKSSDLSAAQSSINAIQNSLTGVSFGNGFTNISSIYTYGLLFYNGATSSNVDVISWYNTVQSALSNFVTSSSLTSTLSSYATTASLSSYALASSLSSYVTTSSLTSTLSSYATTASLSSYALASSLSSYVTTSSLTSTLSSYATTASLSSYASLSGTNNFSGSNTFTGNTTIGTSSTNTVTINSTTLLKSPLSVFQIYENVTAASVMSSVPTLNYALGSVFYIFTDQVPAANFNVNITNIPTVSVTTVQTFVLTLIYTTSAKVFCNAVRVSDTSSSYILGTSSTYSTPLFVGGSPSLTSSNIIVQSFAIVTQYNSTGATKTRNVITNISSCY